MSRSSPEKTSMNGACRAGAKFESTDIRERNADQLFDIATLFNNIYYFPVNNRISLLKHIRTFIRPGGFLLLTTCCQGGSITVEALNLWGAATANAGRLPHRQEMTDQLYAAGYSNVETVSLVAGDAFYSFKADSTGEAGPPRVAGSTSDKTAALWASSLN